ncbi:MAG: hypothetical protein LIP16_07735 [Clostridium sp.]|nr:hypothetical protein [Clostridium sp.]
MEALRNGLAEAEERLEEKDESFLHNAYRVIASGDPELVMRGGQAVGRLLKDYNMQKLIRLSETFRQCTSMEWFLDWSDVQPGKIKKWFISEDDYRYVLILGTFHPNGYFREKCLCAMENCDESLPFIILRMNDWVGNIRRRAADMALGKIPGCPVQELFYAVQAMDKIRGAGRRAYADLIQAEELLEKRLEQEAGNLSVEEIPDFEFGVRKSIYRYLFSKRILKRDQADRLLSGEKNRFCQSVIISGILDHYGCSAEQSEKYLHHKHSCVRRKALEYQYGIIKNAWPGLEDFLLDTSAGIREFTAFVLERYKQFDVLGFYLAHLKDENPVVPVLETGRRGSREHEQLIRPFLSHPRGKVVSSAVSAIGALAGREAADIYWLSLFDHRASVAKAAYCSAVKNSISYGAGTLFEAIRSGGFPWTKRYLVYLLIKEPCWERIPYLLPLYVDEGLGDLRDKILQGLGGRSLYCRITAAQGQAVIQALEAYGESLPRNLVKEIRFDLKFVAER